MTILTISPRFGQFGQNGHANFCIALFALSALLPTIVQIVQKVQSDFFLLGTILGCLGRTNYLQDVSYSLDIP